MRIIIRTVSLILVLGLQSVCLGAKAEKSTLDIAESVERYVAVAQKQAQAEVEEALTEAQKEMAIAQEEIEANEWVFDGVESKWSPPSASPLKLLRDITGTGHSGTENILVIPEGQMAGEQLGEIIEDMNIMSRIFEKDLKKVDKLSASRFYFAVGHQSAGAPRNIYLEGYGALFLMEVDFPLLPLAQAEEKETEEEDVDRVWQQAKREVYQSPNDRHFKIESEDEHEEYDAAKVEGLKTRLVRNLKHASNIRNLKSSEWIIVAVTGSGGESTEIHISTGYGRTGVMGRSGRSGGRSRSPRDGRAGGSSGGAQGGRFGGGGGFGGGFTGGLSTTPASATVLTVRAKKSDVDAFAKGKLNLEQFQKRVQMFTYLGSSFARGLEWNNFR